MTDTPNIPPALLPSQWKAFFMWLEYGSPPVKSPAFPIFEQAFVDRATMHALAAMCLNAPPGIGFTQDELAMLEALREGLIVNEVGAWVDVGISYAHAALLPALVAKIAALLPPK